MVTVGVASYNNGKYIRETLESIRLQTYANQELIIVDDCSTDDSVQVIERWLSEFPAMRARLIRHPVNRGVCAVCNLVLAEAKGKYLSIVGSDDVFLPQKTSQQVAEMQALQADYAVIYSDMYIIDEHGKRSAHTQLRSQEPGFEVDEGDIFEREILRNRINSPSAMMLTEAAREVGGYDEELSFEDWDMWLRLSRRFKVKYSHFIGVEYRVLATSAWHKRGQKFYESSIKTLIKHLGINDKVDRMVLSGVENYGQLLYKLYGPSATKWLYFALKRQPSLKLGILTLMATIKLPYALYDRVVRVIKL